MLPLRSPIDLLVRRSGRSWWEAMLLGGATLGEWQTTGAPRALQLPLARYVASSRWSEVDHSKVVAMRLWCPDGRIGEVQGTGPYRIFQFKAGRRKSSRADTIVDAHVIGTLTDDEGGCSGWEWTATGLRQFTGNVRTLHQRYGQGALNLEAIGIRL